MLNDRPTRKCPVCENGFVYLSDLVEMPDGANCTYCHKVIEIDFFYSAGIPVVLAFLLVMFFRLELDFLGYATLCFFAFFIAGYKSFFMAYLPLKHYANN